MPDADVRFDHAPYLKFNDDEIKFDTKHVSNANDNYGSASGFLSKYLDIRKSVPYGDAFSISVYLSVSNHQASCLSRRWEAEARYTFWGRWLWILA